MTPEQLASELPAHVKQALLELAEWQTRNGRIEQLFCLTATLGAILQESKANNPTPMPAALEKMRIAIIEASTPLFRYTLEAFKHRQPPNPGGSPQTH